MEGYRKAVSFVPYFLDQMQRRSVAVQKQRLVMALDIKDFFLFSDSGQGKIIDSEAGESLEGRVELTLAPIDEYQIRKL